jgi:pimeloyl-ACP methyl ester carboxylesterase
MRGPHGGPRFGGVENATMLEGPRTARGGRARMLTGLPLSERRLRLAGVSTALLEGGAGPPLVLLHGGIECGGAYWAPVLARLAQQHRLVVPDHPGLGESAPLANGDAGGFSQWLHALIEETCDEEPALVAHSLVGALACRFAARAPGHLRRLAIYASPGVAPYRMPLPLRAVAIRFSLRPSEQNMARFQRFALHDPDRVRARDRGWFDAWTAYTASRARDAAVKRTVRALVRTGTKQVPERELRAIDAPVALLWGSEDRMTPVALAEGARKRLGWPLQVIERAGHLPHIEEPDAFLAALAEWERAG